MDSPASTAVFISYASQDAAAALRLCEALRAAGIEVWFDQAELAGGDVWDRKIRGQLASCALFLPVISAATQARREGYFRLEWKLAAQRTHMISERTAFLLPVVIDETRDAEADVPGEFRAVQWTRLPDGAPTPQFVERVKKLLDGPELETGRPRPVERGEGAASPTRQSATAKVGRRVPAAAWLGAIAVIAIGVGATFFATRKSEPASPNEGAGTRPPTPSSISQLPSSAASAAAAPAAASVAVLAFANMSADKDTEYFSDGISEELLNVLAKLPGLKVSARTSAFFYKGKQVPIKQVAQELGVAYVVEGSVRKSGDRVRITAQLIKADDSFHVWSDNFDRELKDIFAVQDEIAGLIAKNLSLKLGLAPAASSVAAAPTQNLAAYDLYLRGRAAQTSGTGLTPRRNAEQLYKDALQLDPGYALASARLAQVFCSSRSDGYDHSEQNAARTREAALTAVRLDPNLPEAHLALALVRLSIDYDLVAAQRELDEADRLRPNDPEAPAVRLELESARGRWGDALVKLATRAVELDPLNAITIQKVAEILRETGHFAEADRHYLTEGGNNSVRLRASNYLAWTGDLAGALTMLEALPERVLRSTLFRRDHARLQAMAGRFQAAIDNYEHFRSRDMSSAASGPRQVAIESILRIGQLEARLGRSARATELYSEALDAFRRYSQDFPDQPFGPQLRATIHAQRGEKSEARTAMAEATQLAARTHHASTIAAVRRTNAATLALLGETAAALAELRSVHEMGYGFGYRLRHQLEWEPLRVDTKFQQLMKEAEARADAQPRPKK